LVELYQIDPQFAQRMVAMRGEAGRAWIDQLPTTIAELAQRWSLLVHPPFRNLSFNYVLPATQADGRPAVLKLGYPADTELRTEIAALAAFAGHGMARLLEADPEQAAMLLERVEPGRPLTTLADDEAATRIAADLMRDFWPSIPAGHAFPSVADWGRGFERMRDRFDGGSGSIPAPLADRAERLFAELLQSRASPVLLHGDLHHDNILSGAGGSWRAIDPKGVTGEPVYELGAFLRNPGTLLSNPDAAAITERRIAIFAEMLGFDRDRILAWAQAQMVLSAWWTIEDNDAGLDRAIALAELFAAIPAPGV
jgi:streptomycin 6-kinase